MMKEGKFWTFFYILVAAVVLCFMGFYNGYPLVFSDTGTYIDCGFKNVVPLDRPMFYGYFVRHISMKESLWYVIIAQGIIVSASIYLFFKYLIKAQISKSLLLLIFVLIITVLTGVSVNVCQLIPDVFTPVMGLTLILLLMAKGMNKLDYTITSIIFVFSLSTHASHFPTVFFVLVLFGLFFLIKKFRIKLVKIASLKNYLAAIIFSVFTFFMVCSVHYAVSKKFAVNYSSHVFFMTRMVETGLVQEYLNENCENNQYKFCEYRNQIPWDFLWDGENSPLYKTGGWEANREEYNDILGKMLSNPKYLKKFVLISLESGLKQFFQFDTGDTPILNETSSPFRVIIENYKYQRKEYFSSRQNRGMLNYDFVNLTQKFLIMFCFVLNFVFLSMTKIDGTLKLVTVLILFFLISNAFVCGSLSIITPRYQSRVIWLMVVPVFIYVVNRIKFKKVISSEE